MNLGLDGYYAIQPNGTRSAFMDFYNLPVTASGDLVSSNYTNGTLSVVGDLLINLGSGDVVHVGVPAGFVSGSSYLGTSTVIGANFATYGIADGQSTTLSFAVSGGTETITFTAIPEPSGVLLSMLAGSVMLVRRKRRV